MRRAFALMVGAVILLTSLATSASAEEAAVTAERAEELVAALDALRRESLIPGLSIAVVDDGELVLATGLGFADLAARRPASATTPYDIASVSKPISAVAVMKLVELGLLDLDEPIASYSDWVEFCLAFSEQPSIFARDLRCEPPVHTMRQLLSHTAAGRPGERFSYNPILYSWASRPVMAVTETSFSDLVTRHVLEPAVMSSSARRHRTLALPKPIAQEVAPPHLVDESGALVRAPDLEPQGDGAAGGIVSTVIDLARFDIALDSGQLLSRESRDAMMRPVVNEAGEALPYGIGWFVQEYRGVELVWHSGWWEDAYSALYLKVPERRVSLILLANSEGLWWENPLDRAEVEKSPFARAFLRIWLGE